MKSEFGISTYGEPIVIREIGEPPMIRTIMVAITLTLGLWVLVHVNRSVISSLGQFKSLFTSMTTEVNDAIGSLKSGFGLVYGFYVLHQIIHVLHFADNIARPVDYFEPKWLYDKFVASIMEITFAFNIPVSIFGASVATNLLINTLRLMESIAKSIGGDSQQEFNDNNSAIEQNEQSLVPKEIESNDISKLLSFCNQLLIYTSSAALTVMHYRVESMFLYSPITTFTIAGEGIAGFALGISIWYLRRQINSLVHLTPRHWQALPQKEGSTQAEILSQAEFPLSPEEGRSSTKTTEASPSQGAVRSPTTSQQIRHRSPMIWLGGVETAGICCIVQMQLKHVRVALAWLIVVCVYWNWSASPALQISEHPTSPTPSLYAVDSAAIFLEKEVAVTSLTAKSSGQLQHLTRLENLRLLQSNPQWIQDAALIMVVYNDASSWGENRSFEDFIDLILALSTPSQQLSLGILTSSAQEYDKLVVIAKDIIQQFAQITVMLRNDFSTMAREGRHDARKQRERRRMLARYRNVALTQSLASWHNHVVWVDADIVSIPLSLVDKMIQADKDILEPLCLLEGKNSEYDRNAWVGWRKQPTSQELQRMHEDSSFIFEPKLLSGTQLIGDYTASGVEYVKLDSVGGTMLYVKADIHRQGVLFATDYIVGTTWEDEGYDGIETEGLCYTASLLGYFCWGMPQDVIYHVGDNHAKYQAESNRMRKHIFDS